MKKKQQDGDILKYLCKTMRIMRLSLFLIVISTAMAFSANSYSQNTKLTLDLNNATVIEVIKAIENQSEFLFFYQEKHVDLNRQVTMHATEQDVETILNQLFAGTDNIYVINDRQIVIGVAPRKELERQMVRLNEKMKPLIDQPQQKEISGKVTDTGGLPLPGVSVVVKGTTIGTVTNNDGEFSLNIPLNAETLQFSFVGMKTQEIPVEGRNTFTIVMEEDVFGIEEVVAVGYGTQSTRHVTGSIQQLNMGKLEDIPVTQFSQKLQGRLAGVQINQTTGIPGQGMSIRVRGQGSISASMQPLIVMDGFPITGDINNINPNEIETITILKDAASTSLYGSRAANGVLLIQTKRGRIGEPRVDVSAFYGLQQVPQKGRPDMMNATEFAQFKKEVFEFRGQEVPDYWKNPESFGEGTDWFDIMLQTAPIQDYNVTFSSGTDKVRNSAVLGVFNQKGVVLNSDYSRYSLRINSDIKLGNRVNMGVGVAPSYSINTAPNTDGLWTASATGILLSALLTSPTVPHINPDGTLPLTAFPADRPATSSTTSMFRNPNWYQQVQDVERVTKTSRLLANAFAEYEIIDGLTLKSALSFDLGQSDFFGFYPSTTARMTVAPPSIPFSQTVVNNYLSWVFENTATYKKKVQDHSFEVLGGYSAQKYSNNIYRILARDYPDDKVKTINAATTITANSDIQEWSLLSYFGRLNYNFKGKYLLALAMRRDGSSRFGSGNRWGDFPSVSAGWILTDEAFFPQNDLVSFLKLRGSYGTIGNFNIGNYSHQSSVGGANYVFDNTIANGRSLSSMGNTLLGWEKTVQSDIGFDVRFFHDKISLTYDYYVKNTSALLYNINIPWSSGFSNIQSNVGEIKFWGHEITLSAQPLDKRFKWNVDFNISFNRNEIMSLGIDNEPLFGSQSINKVGQPLGMFYGFVHDGIYTQAEIDDPNVAKHAMSAAGTVKMRDVNGDGVIIRGNEPGGDFDIIGNPNPDFIFGFVNSFTYQNFDLTIVASGSYGNQIFRRINEYFWNQDGVFNVDRAVMNRWKSETDPGDGILGQVGTGRTEMARLPNSRFIYDGSHLAIKNITFGYSLPVGRINYISNLRVYASVQQPFVFTSYPGNPEVSSVSGGARLNNIASEGAARTPPDARDIGQDWMTYPVPRTFTLGLDVGF